MESFSVRTTLNLGDWHALMAAARERVIGAARVKGSLIYRHAPKLLWVVVVVALVYMMNTRPPLVRPLGMLLVGVTIACAFWLVYAMQRRATVPDERGAFLGDRQIDFEADGFRASQVDSNTFNRWPLVIEVTHTADHIFVWIDSFSAYIVPTRDLPAPLTVSTAVSRLQEFMAAASREAKAEPVAVSAPAPTLDLPVAESKVALPARFPSVAQELAALLRLHIWRPVGEMALYGRDVTLILLGVFCFVLWAGLDRLDYGSDVELYWYAISETGVLVLAALALGWVFSRMSRPRVEYRRSLLLVVGFLPLFVAGFWLAMKLPRIPALVSFVALLAAADVYLVTGMRSLTGKRQQAAVTSVIVFAMLLLYLGFRFELSPGIWYEPETQTEETEGAQRESEQLVYDQSARLDEAIDKLAPRDAAKTNVFFVGFAGFEGQRVFAEEIGLAAKRIDERYDAGGRSVLLVNDRRDSAKYPLANSPALRHALLSLGKRMNLDEDVLFLSLSSHGSEDSISVTSEFGYWRDLEASELAEMLRESGIRWKVIVISACHAGSFIEDLRDENTIILAAAAADRTSFGCSDRNKLTYFGAAFYRDALPKAASLRAAFEIARAAIEKREDEEGKTPSMPQAHFGAELEKKLATFEATLDR